MRIFKSDLFKLVIPIFLEIFLMNLLGFFDTFMISKFSTDSVVAIGNSTTVMGIFLILLNVASRGSNVIISQFLGAHNEAEAHKTLHSGIVFNFLFSLILLIIVELFGYELLRIIRVDQRYINEAFNYLKIVSIGIPFLAVTNVFSATFRSYKKPKILTYTALFSNLINIILNYILIFGLNGAFAPLGSAGAAIATLISYIINFVIGYIFLKRLLHIKIFTLDIHKRNLMMLLKIGLPSALESFVYTFCNLALMAAVNILDSKLPGLAAGRNYLNQMLGFTLNLSSAFGIANSILVGHLVGAGRLDEAKRVTFKSGFICVPLVMLVLLTIFIFKNQLFMLFKPNNEADMDLFNVAFNQIMLVLPYIFLLELGRSNNLIFVQALQASGDVIFPLISAIISMVVFMAIGSYTLGIVLNLGLLGIYLGCILDECTRAVLMIIRWSMNTWKTKSLVKHE